MCRVKEEYQQEKKYTLRECYRVIEKVTGEKLKGHELFNPIKNEDK